MHTSPLRRPFRVSILDTHLHQFVVHANSPGEARRLAQHNWLQLIFPGADTPPTDHAVVTVFNVHPLNESHVQ